MKKKHPVRRIAALLLSAALILGMSACAGAPSNVRELQAKLELLRQEVLSDWVRESLDESPAGEAGYAVFVSVCGGQKRADVYCGTGETLDAAWDSAAGQAAGGLAESGVQANWVRADVAYHSETLPAGELEAAVRQTKEGFFRYGLALDSGFSCALLEGELNGAGIYDYQNGGVDQEALERYLQAAGRTGPEGLPESYQVFGCAGWLCDEDSTVWKLEVSGPATGRRAPGLIDGEMAKELSGAGAEFLAGQVKEDGSFVYSLDPRTGQEEEEGYSNLRHAGAVWSLLLAYRDATSDALADKIGLSLDYLISQLGYDPDGRAFLPEPDGGEVKLGAGAMALIALAEYTDITQDDTYIEDCRALGGGLISMMDPEDGSFVHVLGPDLTLKEEFRTPSYDAEAAYALSRLYGLTGEQIWIEAACLAVDRMIAGDYTQYQDPWVSYAMNEITKYVTDRPEYYIFALENAQKNLKSIYEQEQSQPASLELLMSAFELYDRLTTLGGTAEGFDPRLLLGTIYVRADRALDGYLYPETAMYLAAPQQVLNGFMARQEGFRVRIDDVQHSIAGYYLYAKNYDGLLAAGLLENEGQ